MELRFSRSVRQIMVAVFVLHVFFYLPVMSYIPSLAFSQVTGMNIHIINSIACCVCMVYTMLGGIKAVVWTDVLQASVMLGSSFLIVTLAIWKIGGFGVAFERAYDGGRLEFFNFDFDPQTRNTFWNSIFGYSIMWLSYLGLNQSCVQRIIAVPSVSHARKTLGIFYLGYFIVTTLTCLTGMIMYSWYHDCDPVKAGVIVSSYNCYSYILHFLTILLFFTSL